MFLIGEVFLDTVFQWKPWEGDEFRYYKSVCCVENHKLVQTSLVTSFIYIYTQDGPLPVRSSRVISQLRVITPITHV